MPAIHFLGSAGAEYRSGEEIRLPNGHPGAG